jgi:uncharacterized iron-regulated protein
MKPNSRSSHCQATCRALCAAALVQVLVLPLAGTVHAVSETETMNAIVVEPADSATLPQLVAKLAGERVVYVGETHTALADHQVQLEVLRAMAAQPGELAVGVEWFQHPFQPVLDDYLAGRIDEAELLRRSEYYERWRFDYRLYRPIMQFARDNGIPVLALNAPRELTRAISSVGIDGLDAEQRANLPDGYDFDDSAYADKLRQVFLQHAGGSGDFRRFLEVQLTWDERMAQGAAEYLNGSPERRILVLAGRGHIAGRGGIPNRVTRRTGLHGATIATYDPSGSLFNETDYLVLTREQRLAPPGLMLVALDERDGGVFVGGFGEDSPAESAGMQSGDRIVAIDGTPIEHFADVKVVLLDRRPGEEIAVWTSSAAGRTGRSSRRRPPRGSRCWRRRRCRW